MARITAENANVNVNIVTGVPRYTAVCFTAVRDITRVGYGAKQFHLNIAQLSPKLGVKSETRKQTYLRRGRYQYLYWRYFKLIIPPSILI